MIAQRTLLYEMPSNTKGKNSSEKYTVIALRIWWKVPAEIKYPHSDWKYLQKVNELRFWLKVLAESKCKILSDFLWKKECYLSKEHFFSSEIWGHLAFFFCRYFQSESEVIYLLQVLSIKIWGYLPYADTFHLILRAITVYF